MSRTPYPDEEMIGKKFGLLTVVERVKSEKYSRRGKHYLCKCDCGNETIACGFDLRTGKRVSCGCYRRPRKKEEKPRERTPFVTSEKAMQYNAYRRTLCERYERRCLTAHCPLGKLGCYQYRTIGDMAMMASRGLYKKILLSLKEEAKKEGIELP